MTNPVALETDGDVAVIVIDNPPINAGSLAVRRGLVAAIEEAAASASVRALVLVGAGKTFIAGSDIKEFGAPIEKPSLPDVIAALERCPKPVVAAIHGAALGGGFELALACDARIATADAMVGLPEVSLASSPGRAGPERLPRLVGVARAIELIAAGERIRGDAAQSLGLVDAIVEGNLRARGSQLCTRVSSDRKRRVRDMPVPKDEAELIETAEASAIPRRARAGQPFELPSKRSSHRRPMQLTKRSPRSVRCSRTCGVPVKRRPCGINSSRSASPPSIRTWRVCNRGRSNRSPSSVPAPWGRVSLSRHSMAASTSCCWKRDEAALGRGHKAHRGVLRRSREERKVAGCAGVRAAMGDWQPTGRLAAIGIRRSHHRGGVRGPGGQEGSLPAPVLGGAA